MAKYEILADTQNKISLWQKFNARTQNLFQIGGILAQGTLTQEAFTKHGKSGAKAFDALMGD
ncbi:hypothetical protein [Lactococcus ileimucosae]|uniref:hypothetical protein n=1 Tax=Lactococcus ileimucosae TaxID=2941329 RepID=UPI0020445572|nr:hypothetical protein [Lactococcus ileimucosae]